MSARWFNADIIDKPALDGSGNWICVDEDGDELFLSDDDMDDVLDRVARDFADRINSISNAQKTTTTTTTKTTTTTTEGASGGVRGGAGYSTRELEAGIPSKKSSHRWSQVAGELKKAPTQVQEKMAVVNTTQRGNDVSTIVQNRKQTLQEQPSNDSLPNELGNE